MRCKCGCWHSTDWVWVNPWFHPMYVSEVIVSMINMCVHPLDFALVSLAQLSLVRSAAVSISVNHSSNFVESCSLKMAMSCSSEFVRFVCFCVLHSLSMYWCTTCLNSSMGAGVEGIHVVNARERFCSTLSRWSMQSNPSVGWPSPTSTYSCKWLISLVSNFKSAWLLDRGSLRWPFASAPPKATIVSELCSLSLSLLGPISMPLASSM